MICKCWLKAVLVPFLLVQYSTVSSAACYGSYYYSSSGSISCPTSGDTYSDNENVGWHISIHSVIRIRFIRFNTEPGYDKVSIFEASKELFRLSGSDTYLLNSEFWLNGPVHIRFTSDSSSTRTGFQLKYDSHHYGSIAAATEVINSSSGSRKSHLDFGSEDYLHNYKVAWSIYAPLNSYVSVAINNLDTETCCDFLKIYPGIVPNVGSVILDTFSGSKTGSRTFPYSITLVFITDHSWDGEGFQFQFSVSLADPSKFSTNLHSWTGQPAGSSFDLQLYAASYGASAWCSLNHACQNEQVVVTPTSANFYSSYWHFSFNLRTAAIPATYCISNVTCTVDFYSISSWRLEKTFPLVVFDPQLIKIEPTTRGVWFRADIVQFHAVSVPVCPNVRHSCEIRMADGGRIHANQNSITATSTSTACSVTSPHQLSMQISQAATSVITCLLKNGSSVVQPVIIPDQRVEWDFANWTGQTSSGSFSISLEPGVGIDAAVCTLKHDDCVPDTIGTIETKINGTTALFHSNLTSEHCVSTISCEFTAQNGWRINKSVVPSRVHPAVLRIDLIDHDYWYLVGANRFIVTSEDVCPMVRHHCELRAANGSSQLAQQVKFDIYPLDYTSCQLVRLQTTFILPVSVPILEGDVIACNIAGGISTRKIISDAHNSLDLIPNRWNGLSSGGSFTLQLQPAYTNTMSTCHLQNACRQNERIAINSNKSWSNSSLKIFWFDITAALEVPSNYCISTITCTVQLSTGKILSLERTFPTAESNPQSISIDQHSSELRYLTGILKFNVVSQPACPNIRHRCVLRGHSGNLTRVQKIYSVVTAISDTCSTQTQFQIRSESLYDSTSVIACQLLNGDYVVKPLILRDQNISWMLFNWTGKTSSGSFSVSLDPGFGVETADCSLTRDTECDTATEADDLHDAMTLSSDIVGTTVWFHSSQLIASEDCMSRITCKFTASNGWERIASIEPQTTLPSATKIDLISSDTWSIYEENLFIATSDDVCPCVRHQCEIRSESTNSESVGSISVTVISSNYFCNSSKLQTKFGFTFPANASVFHGYAIACRLSGGDFEMKYLEVDDNAEHLTISFLNRLQVKLVILIATLAIAVLLVFTAILAAVKVAIKRHQSIREMTRTKPEAHPSMAEEHDLQVRNPVYAEDIENYEYIAYID